MLASLSLEVIDPANRTGKITIPMSNIAETRGVIDHQRNPDTRDVKDLSLCLLFQKGRCNAGTRCHQVHADPAFVQHLREKAAAGRNCCARHGDTNSLGFLHAASEMQTMAIVSPEGHVVYSIQDFARTAPLDQLMRRGAKSASANKICRLHMKGRCKFGKDCKNIHLCPEAKPLQTGCLPQFTTPTKTLQQSESVSLSGSSLKDTCGLSYTSSTKSSQPDSPLEKSLPPLDVADISVRSDSGFALFTQPLKSVKQPSPQFDVTGFETAMSRVQMDLWRVECENARSPAW